MKMKEQFVKRYVDAIRAYFNYTGDREGSIIKQYIMGEYEVILEEEFGVSEEEIKDIYRKEYDAKYFAGRVGA